MFPWSLVIPTCLNHAGYGPRKSLNDNMTWKRRHVILSFSLSLPHSHTWLMCVSKNSRWDSYCMSRRQLMLGLFILAIPKIDGKMKNFPSPQKSNLSWQLHISGNPASNFSWQDVCVSLVTWLLSSQPEWDFLDRPEAGTKTSLFFFKMPHMCLTNTSPSQVIIRVVWGNGIRLYAYC